MELRDDEMAFHYTTNEDGHVNFFFFAPNDAIELAQQSPDVIFIDATYRTNRYNMPLIHFMAVRYWQDSQHCYVLRSVRIGTDVPSSSLHVQATHHRQRQNRSLSY